MNIKFKTTKEYKKLKKDFIIKNFSFGFCYLLFLICFIMYIVCFILSLNTGIMVCILLSFLLLILSVLFLFSLIMEHISEVKEYKVIVWKKQLLPLENIIGKLGEGKKPRGGDDKIE